MRHIWTVAALAVALAACGRSDSNGGVTAEEAAGLNNAAEMLDASPDSLVAPDQTPLGNGDEAVPVDESAAGNAAQ